MVINVKAPASAGAFCVLSNLVEFHLDNREKKIYTEIIRCRNNWAGWCADRVLTVSGK